MGGGKKKQNKTPSILIYHHDAISYRRLSNKSESHMHIKKKEANPFREREKDEKDQRKGSKKHLVK